MDVLKWLCVQWDRVLGIAFIVLGGALLVAGWIGVSGTPHVPDALSYMASGGLGGLFLLGVGGTMLVVATLGDEWRKLDRLEQLLVEELRRSGTGPGESDPTSQPSARKEAEPGLLGRDRRRAALVGGVGSALAAVALLHSWIVTSGTADAQTAVDSVGVGATAVTAQLAVVGLVVVPARRRVSTRASSLLGSLAERLLAQSGRRPATSEHLVEDQVIVVKGLKRYHRAGCAATRGLPTRLVSVPAAVRARREPCGLCQAG